MRGRLPLMSCVTHLRGLPLYKRSMGMAAFFLTASWNRSDVNGCCMLIPDDMLVSASAAAPPHPIPPSALHVLFVWGEQPDRWMGEALEGAGGQGGRGAHLHPQGQTDSRAPCRPPIIGLGCYSGY